MNSFVPLHIHTAFEIGQSLVPVEKLIEQARRNGFPALAITGRHCMFGVPLFEKLCRKQGIQPVLGCEIDVAREESAAPGRLILLAETQQGYFNLVALSSELHAESKECGITWEQLTAHKSGLIAISPLVMQRRGENWHDELEQVFDPEALFYEVAFGNNEQDLPDDLRKRTVPGHAVRYLLPTEETLFRRLCTSFYDDEIASAHLPTPQEVSAWQERFPAAVANSLRIARRCQATSLLDFGEADWPEFEGIEGKIVELREVCRQQISRLYPDRRAAAEERLELELQMARQGGHLIQLEIMAELSEFVRAEGIFLAPVRAEETSGILFYLLGLSLVDPLKFALPPPECLADSTAAAFNIILRLGFAGRMRLIQHLQQKYAGRVAWTKFSTTSIPEEAMRKAAMICGLEAEPTSAAKRLAKDSRTRRLLELAAQIHRLPARRFPYNNVLMLSPRPLAGLIPLDERNRRGQLTLQYSNQSLQRQGFLSIHLWENQATSTLEECLLLIRAHGKPLPDLGAIPLDAAEILAEADREAADGGIWRECCIKEIIAKRWQEWIQAEYPDEYDLARQRIEEMGLRCHDGR